MEVISFYITVLYCDLRVLQLWVRIWKLSGTDSAGTLLVTSYRWIRSICFVLCEIRKSELFQFQRSGMRGCFKSVNRVYSEEPPIFMCNAFWSIVNSLYQSGEHFFSAKFKRQMNSRNFQWIKHQHSVFTSSHYTHISYITISAQLWLYCPHYHSHGKYQKWLHRRKVNFQQITHFG